VRNHRIGSRPHVQGDQRPLRVRHSQKNLTDGGGLVLLRRLFDALYLGGWLDERTGEIGGHYRPPARPLAGEAPFGLEPAPLVHPVERRVEGAILPLDEESERAAGRFILAKR